MSEPPASRRGGPRPRQDRTVGREASSRCLVQRASCVRGEPCAGRYHGFMGRKKKRSSHQWVREDLRTPETEGDAEEAVWDGKSRTQRRDEARALDAKVGTA